MSNKWLDKANPTRKGEELDATALQNYIRAQLPAYQGELEIQQFPGGASNLTYLLKIGDQSLVLRRPPFGPKIKSAHDMGREYGIFSKLIGHYPKVPKPLLFCEDESIIGREFYIMERLEGVILRATMPKEMYPTPVLMSGIADSLIQTFVELHAVDYQAAGLGDLGKPEGYNERQVKGWSKRYLRAQTDEIKEFDFVRKWLVDNLLPESDAALIHNDYKYDNVILDNKDWTKIIGILDWEMSTLGDPLMDLGTSICYWTNRNDPDWAKQIGLSPTIIEGNPTRSEVAKRYSELSGRDISNIVYYYVFGLFKIAVVVQQIYKRYVTGFSSNPKFANMGQVAKSLSIMATQAIRKNDIEDLF